MRAWLKKYREEKGYTQAQTAQLAGISQQMYAFIENGKRCEPTKNNTEKAIATVLGFNWTRFFEESE